MAIRTAIGASRWRIARQLLMESLLLALVGGGIGVALAVWGTNALLAGSPRNLLDLRSVSMDLRVLTFAVGATLLAGLLYGFLPEVDPYNRNGTRLLLRQGGRLPAVDRARRLFRRASSEPAVARALRSSCGQRPRRRSGLFQHHGYSPARRPSFQRTRAGGR